MRSRSDSRGTLRRRRPAFRALGALLAFACAACQSGAPRQTMLMQSIPGLELTVNQLRFLVLDYHDYFVSTIEIAARDMAVQQTDRGQLMNTITWRNNSVSAAQEFAFRPDPLAALIEMMILSARMRDYFDGPASEELFGLPYPLAVEAAHSLDRRGRDLARHITDTPDLDERLARVDSAAAAEPLTDLDFLEESSFASPENFLTESGGGLATLGSIEQTTRDLNERVNVFYRYLPKQLRWEMELLALRAYEVAGEDVLADVDEIAGALSGLEGRVAMLTDSLAVEIGVLANQVIAAERSAILDEVDRERLATIDALHAELELVLADVERQRTETIHFVADLVAEARTDVVADADTIIDEVLGRVTRLVLGMGLGLFIGLIALVLLYNRTRPAAEVR